MSGKIAVYRALTDLRKFHAVVSVTLGRQSSAQREFENPVFISSLPEDTGAKSRSKHCRKLKGLINKLKVMVLNNFLQFYQP